MTGNGVKIVLIGLGLIVLMAVMGPKVGPIGVGTFIALVVAVVAIYYVVRGKGD